MGCCSSANQFAAHRSRRAAATLLNLLPGLLLLAAAGCQTPPSPPAENVPPASAEVVLHVGDTVRVSFPGTPSLNSPGQQIRPDGKITLPLLSEVSVAGMTPSQLESELTRRYDKE